MTKSRSGGAFVPMVNGYDKKSADDSEGEREGCRLTCGGVPVCYEGIVLCFP